MAATNASRPQPKIKTEPESCEQYVPVPALQLFTDHFDKVLNCMDDMDEVNKSEGGSLFPPGF